MKASPFGTARLAFLVFVLLTIALPPALAAPGDATYQTLPFAQDWSNTAQITTNDDWSGVPGIMGYRGDGLTASNDVDPQTVLGPDAPGVLDVNANQSNPSTFSADDLAEFDRQWPKTVAAIVAGGADVIAFSEIENDGYGPDSAVQFLVDRLNAATAPGTYAFIDADAGTRQTNALGTDAIKVGLLYKPGRVTPVGQTAALNTSTFVNGGDGSPRNRPALAQAFQQADGERLVVVANHFKSKGSACDVHRPDLLLAGEVGIRAR